MGTLLAGLEPLVFLACGVYAGAVYGGIVGVLLGARDSRVDIEELDSASPRAA